jgi:hypothetical protein
MTVPLNYNIEASNRAKLNPDQSDGQGDADVRSGRPTHIQWREAFQILTDEALRAICRVTVND